MLLTVGAEGEAAAQEPRALHALLDVPYMAQPPELCGGAAVSMVLRFWGARDVFPQDFAPLVTPSESGIVTTALAAAVRERGWLVVVTTAEADGHARLRSELDRGRPMIALIEVAPHTYHYVVVVGATDREVVVHDPARSAFRVLHWTDFERAWAPTGRWTMLVLPSGGLPQGTSPARPPLISSGESPSAQGACQKLVSSGVALAIVGDRDGAEQVLTAATGLCPTDAAPWLELAGLRFAQARWAEAETLAVSAVRLTPTDPYAWQLVASSRSLMGDEMGALAAWNRIGEPRVDLVSVRGAERTRQPVVLRAAALPPRVVLTPEVFTRAVRRVRDVPAAAGARLRYETLDGGLARVEVFIDERPVAPKGLVALASLAARALLLDEVRVNLAGPLGAGELGTAAWRWQANRPSVALGLALPSPQWFGGVLTLDGSWERQTYTAAPTDPEATVRDVRRQVGIHLADWSASWLHWRAGAAFDHLRQNDGFEQARVDGRDYLALDGVLDVRLAGDRLAVAAAAAWWTPFAGGNRFATGGLRGAWRSTIDLGRPWWSAVTEFGVASRVAPLALWNGAGTGQGRSGLLRAHPLLDDGVVTGAVFGRELWRGTLEYSRPLHAAPAGALAIAAFADAARAWHRLTGQGPSWLHVDAGVGLRLRAPGDDAVVRLDVARGLRGGGTTLSASWGGAWPR
ncbi:MAG: C39 family peptidase [Vicinamibacterales bacterium]